MVISVFSQTIGKTRVFLSGFTLIINVKQVSFPVPDCQESQERRIQGAGEASFEKPEITENN